MRAFVATLPLIVSVLIGAPAAQANANHSHEAVTATVTTTATQLPSYPPYPPYPPGNCLRHYERPTRLGWKIELVWWGGRSCPRVFFWPAKAEIWMYQGTSAPRSGPWTNDGSEPAASYGGHEQADAAGTSGQPAGTWWEKVKTVRVNRDGSWSAEIHVTEEGPYTFAGVNSISREYVLVEVEVWDDLGGGGGTAGGSDPVPAAVVNGPDARAGDDPLLRIGVPVASSTLVMLLTVGLVLRARARRLRRVTRPDG